ncbi:MAG TPA: hypothetical protein VL157_01875 [Gemmatimonadaceae bacterium]|nr:hypothetical protein [Gemmatimonadaceae bacterium]
MAKCFDTSSIPDDAAYWDALASRVSASVRRRHSAVAWVGSRERRWMLTAYAAAAVLAVAALLTIGRPPRTEAPAQLALVLAPNDALGRVLARSVAPPALTELEMAPSRRAGEEP